MSKRDKDRLSTALDSLPAEIAWLRDSILGIAKQDQDLLGSGEADTNVVARALREHSKTSIEDDAMIAADLLQGWLEGQQDNGIAWAGPAWFVYGFLRGGQLFATDEEEPIETPPPPPIGLQQVELDVPKGMKTKLHAGGLEMSNREVTIFVIELEELGYEIRWVQARSSQPAAKMPPPFTQPEFLNERENHFKIGTNTGERFIMRHMDSGLPVHCGYVLVFPDVKVEIGITSRKPLGFDLRKYEPMLATIRRKHP